MTAKHIRILLFSVYCSVMLTTVEAAKAVAEESKKPLEDMVSIALAIDININIELFNLHAGLVGIQKYKEHELLKQIPLIHQNGRNYKSFVVRCNQNLQQINILVLNGDGPAFYIYLTSDDGQFRGAVYKETGQLGKVLWDMETELAFNKELKFWLEWLSNPHLN